MKKVFTFLLIIPFFLLHSQMKEVISSSGNSIANELHINGTLGQGFVNQTGFGEWHLSEGFQQVDHQFKKVELPLKYVITPNPTTNEIMIKGQDVISEVSIFNVDGQLMFIQQCESTDYLELSLAELIGGVYIIRVVSSKGFSQSQKVIKI